MAQNILILLRPSFVLVLFSVFLAFFGVPSAQKYFQQDTFISKTVEVNKMLPTPAVTVCNMENSVENEKEKSSNAPLRSTEGGMLIGIKCKIRSRAFMWSPFDLIERTKIKILCLFHKKKYFLTLKT